MLPTLKKLKGQIILGLSVRTKNKLRFLNFIERFPAKNNTRIFMNSGLSFCGFMPLLKDHNEIF